jgi:hypothetical protein
VYCIVDFADVLQRYYELVYLVVVTWWVLLFFFLLAILYTHLLLPLPTSSSSRPHFFFSLLISFLSSLRHSSLFLPPSSLFSPHCFSTFPSSHTNIVPYILNHPDIISRSLTHSPTHSLFLGTEYGWILQM